MLRLQRNYQASAPNTDGTISHKFCRAVRTLDEQSGKVVITRQVIPDREFRHEGETCEMMSLENQRAMGIELRVVNQRYGSLSLEDRQNAMSQFDALVSSPEFQQPLTPQENG